MPLAFDSSLALRPDVGVGARAPQPERATAEAERARFAAELERVQRAAPSNAAQPGSLVPAARTRLSGEEAAQALSAAWQHVNGEPPSDQTLSILVGQWAHETGRGQSMLNFNFGGLKGTGPTGLSTAARTREGWGDSEVRVVDRFRAYASAEDGARDYVSLLARRYPQAVSAAQAGDTQGFVRALKAGGYFTDNEAAYTKSVQSLATQARVAGFDAVGAGTGAGALPTDDATLMQALALGEAGVTQPTTQLGADMPLAGGALLEASPELSRDALATLPVAPGAFADEVSRAALLMSALRIAEPNGKRSGA